MNLKEIVDLCKGGQAAEAYDESRRQLALNPEDRYARVGASYAIKSLVESAVASGNDDTALRLLDEYADLHLEEIDEQEMNNRLVWAVRSLILSWKERGVSAARQMALLDAIKQINFLKPHRYYSVLLDSFLKLRDEQGNPWPGIPMFVEWWGLENLLEEDYKRTLLTNGQSMPSLAERAYSATLKALAAEVAAGRMLPQAESFVQDLDVLEQIHPEYSGILYQKAHLLKAMGRKSEALDAARAFVRKRPNEYWAWSALGDVAETEEARAACYCRALQCRVDPAFQGKVRYKLAVSMYALGQLEFARREFDKVDKLYTQRGWHLPGNLEGIMAQQWYQQTPPAESNRAFYTAMAPRAEQYLNADVPETAVLISNYNPQKNTAGYVTADRKRGFFFTKNLPAQFANYQIYYVRFEGEPAEGKGAKVVSCRRADDITPFDGVFFRQIEAPVGLKPGQSFQFVEDIYVDGNLLRGIQPDTRSIITAVLYYNIKKDSWGWRAVRVRQL